MSTATEELTANEQQAAAIIDALDVQTLSALLAAKGVKAIPETDYQKEIETAKKAAAATATRTAHEDWERAVSETLGEAKPEGIKGVDWAKQKLSQTKQEVTKVKEEAQTAESATVRQLREMIENINKERENEKKQAFQDRIGGVINGTFNAINLAIPDVKADDKEAALAAIREEKAIVFSSKYEAIQTEEGLAWKDKKTGEVQLDPKGRLATPEQIIKTKYPHWLTPEGNAASGLGVKAKSDKAVLQYGSTREEIGDSMKKLAREKGLAETHPDMVKLRKEAYAAAGIVNR